MAGIGSHTKPGRGATDEWFTPPDLIARLGLFDLDPCAPAVRTVQTARRYFTKKEDGLAQVWSGRVWLNPPYGPETGVWLKRLADHGDGMALVFARTETEMFFAQVWDRASACLFIRGRLHFYTAKGRAKGNAGGPSVLAAYGDKNADALKRSGIPGKFIRLQRPK